MPHKWNVNEHRWGARVKVNITVQISSDAVAEVDGRLENLSLSGALLKADWVPKVNSLIDVTISLAPPSHHATGVKARVVRASKGQVGVEWCDIAPSAVKNLIRAPPQELR